MKCRHRASFPKADAGHAWPDPGAFAGSNNFAAELPCLPQAHTPAIILSDQAPTSSHRCGHPERSLARFLLQAESNYLRLFLS